MGVVERSGETLVTGSYDSTLKLWNTTSCECLRTMLMPSRVYCMLKQRHNSNGDSSSYNHSKESFFVCGMENGAIQQRRLSDFSVTFSFYVHYHPVESICELEDGSLVSASHDETLVRWTVTNGSGSGNGTFKVIQRFLGHARWVLKVIRCKRGLIASTSTDRWLKIWKDSNGECTHEWYLDAETQALIRVKDGIFVSSSGDMKLRVWSAVGECIQTITTEYQVTALTRLRDGSLVTGHRHQIAIRRWYVS